MAQNDVKRSHGKQVCHSCRVPEFQFDPPVNTSFLGRALRDIQHGWRGIQQRHVYAKTRQAHSGYSRAAPEIQSVQRPSGLRQRQKILKVRESQVGAQAALGRPKVGGVLVRAALEVLAVGFCGHLHATLRRSRSSIQLLTGTNAWLNRISIPRRTCETFHIVGARHPFQYNYTFVASSVQLRRSSTVQRFVSVELESPPSPGKLAIELAQRRIGLPFPEKVTEPLNSPTLVWTSPGTTARSETLEV